jgi:Rrf2 family iron-sulfur cluster assembly transcriptional regulator
MKLSSKARYAVEAMLELAVHSDRPVTLASISQRQRISQSYLEQLFMRLRRNGLIEGARGPGGGYRLAREAAQISIAEVVLAVDEKAGPQTCDPAGQRYRGEGGAARRMWDDLSQQIFAFLGNVSLGQLVDNWEARKVTRLPTAASLEHSKAA